MKLACFDTIFWLRAQPLCLAWRTLEAKTCLEEGPPPSAVLASARLEVKIVADSPPRHVKSHLSEASNGGRFPGKWTTLMRSVVGPPPPSTFAARRLELTLFSTCSLALPLVSQYADATPRSRVGHRTAPQLHLGRSTPSLPRPARRLPSSFEIPSWRPRHINAGSEG